MSADEVGGRCAIEGALDAIAIAIVDKGGIVERTLRRLGCGWDRGRGRGICRRGAGSGGGRIGGWRRASQREHQFR